MSKTLLGVICGIAFGGVSVLTMISLELPDKKTAIVGAFANRFAIGFVIGATDLPLSGWLRGLLFGLLLSLHDAIITKAWMPIMILGAVGGVVIGFAIGTWGL